MDSTQEIKADSMTATSAPQRGLPDIAALRLPASRRSLFSKIGRRFFPWQPRRDESRALRDAIALTAIGVVLILAAVAFEVADVFFKYSRAHEEWELDEWVLASSVVISWCLVIFSYRRLADAKRLFDTASTDMLTGLLNRRACWDRLRHYTVSANRYGHPLSVIMFDLDDFKRVNDTFGHDAGDRVLRKVADIARRGLRDADILVRWGGEEFVVLCPHTPLSGARVVAERLRQMVEEEFLAAPWKVTTSFGLAEKGEGETAEELLKRIDKHMYEAKAGGKNRVSS